MPIALNEMSTRPAASTTDCRCASTAALVERVDLRRVGGPAGGAMSLRDARRAPGWRPGEEDLGALRREGAGDGAADRAAGAVDHRDLVLQHHLVPFCVGRLSMRVRHRGAAKLGAADRPVRVPAGVYRMRRATSESEVTTTADLITRARAGDGERVPRADRAAPPRAAGALLPDARVVPGRRGRPAGDAAGRLAGPRRVRGARVAAHLALPDRHQPLPQRAPLGRAGARPRRGTCPASTRPSRPGSARSSGSSRIPTPCSRARSTCRSARRPATSRPSRSRWPS